MARKSKKAVEDVTKEALEAAAEEAVEKTDAVQEKELADVLTEEINRVMDRPPLSKEPVDGENTPETAPEEAPAEPRTIMIPIATVQTGTVQSMLKVTTGSCADYKVTFPEPFKEDKEPVVVVGFLSTSTAARFGNCACAVLEGSVTHEGFTIRFYNGDTSSRMPHFSYIAYGVVLKEVEVEDE